MERKKRRKQSDNIEGFFWAAQWSNFLPPQGAAYKSKEFELGDLVVHVDGVKTQGKAVRNLRELILGPFGSEVRVGLLKPSGEVRCLF